MAISALSSYFRYEITQVCFYALRLRNYLTLFQSSLGYSYQIKALVTIIWIGIMSIIDYLVS